MARGGFASSYNDPAYTAWKRSAAEAVQDLIPAGTKMTGDLRVTVVAQKERPKTSKLTRPAPDVDNYAKAVLDAITDSKRVWDDDRQIAHLTSVKRWCRPGEPVGYHVTIEPYEAQ